MKKIFQNCSILFSGLVSLGISLAYYIKSFELYSDVYGTDISFNSDYIAAILVSLCLVIFGVISIYQNIKHKKENILLAPSLGIVASAITSFYPLGYFFKQLGKGKQAGDYLNYLFIGLVALGIFFYFIFKFLSEYSKVETFKKED